MSRKKKIVFIIIAFILAFSIIGISGTIWYFRGLGAPEYSGVETIASLEKEVKISRDKWGIPHFFAENESDLYKAVGYDHAANHLFKMTLFNKLLNGELSATIAAQSKEQRENFIKADLFMRALDIPGKSLKIYNKSPKELKNVYLAYMDGINEYIKKHKDALPVEFKLLSISPPLWKPENVIKTLLFMSWDMDAAKWIEVSFSKAGQKVGKDKYNDLFPSYRNYNDSDPAFNSNADIFRTFAEVSHELGISFSLASNAWAIAASKSNNGKAMLANDMHLPNTNAAGFFTRAHLQTKKGLNVTGVMIPGVPWVIAGHNDKIAWGITNAQIDHADFFYWTPEYLKSNQYFHKNQWKDFVVKKVSIEIKDQAPVEKEIKYTVYGPVISDYQVIDKGIVALKRISDYARDDETLFFQLMSHAENKEDILQAAQKNFCLGLNIIYADEKGKVGWKFSGGIPKRKDFSGASFVPGWLGHDWQGFIPFAKLPEVYNPSSGYIAMENNRPPDSSITEGWFSDSSRYKRMTEFLGQDKKFGIEDMQALQTDYKSVLAETITPLILPLIQPENQDTSNKSGKSEKYRAAYNILKTWDYKFTKESIGATIFQKFHNIFIKNICADEMKEKWEKLDSSDLLWKIWNNMNSKWCDDANTDKKETCGNIVQKSFTETVDTLTNEAGSDLNKWLWGNFHTIQFTHPIGENIKILDIALKLSSDVYPVGGASHTVAVYASRNKEVLHGAVHRQIYVVGDWDKSLSVLPTGVSGVPSGEFYSNQTKMYVHNEYHPDCFSDEAIHKANKYKLILTAKEPNRR
jgi:penicillin G amidase